MATAVGWAPIVKSEKRDDGTLVITGRAASSAVDRDYQIADEAWLGKALGQWFGEADGGNIREQHDGKRAVGTALTYKADDHEISAHIVDPITVAKIENRVLKGFSWSARNARVKLDKAAAGGRIVDGQIYEVSVVDRPANPECLFTVAKADGDGNLVEVAEPEFVEVEATEKADEGEPVDVIEKTDGKVVAPSPAYLAELLKSLGKTPGATAGVPAAEKADIAKREFSQDERDDAADKGQALPDGSFPIKTKADLENAIKAYGRAKDPAAAKKHIIKRARALDAVSELPEDWNVSKADAVIAQIAAMVPGRDITKDDAGDEVQDVSDGKSAIACIARLIISEAESLAAGNMNEIWDIQTLVNAACALQCFVDSETWEGAEAAMTQIKADTDTADTATAAVAEATSTEKADTETMTGTTPATEKTDAPPAEGEVVTEKALSDLLEAAITKAVQPYKDELELVKADMAKVLETPKPGGPARTRTTTHTAVAAKADELRTEIAYCQQQVRITGGELQKGYRTRLDEAETELRKLDGAAA